MKILFIHVAFLFIFSPAWAQVDNGRLYLPSSGAATAPKLESDRFTVRPTTKRQTAPAQTPVTEPAKSPVVKSEVVPELKPATIPAAAPAPKVTEAPPVKVIQADPDDREGETVHDARVNIVNISISPTLHYLDSKSDYWFRNYATSGPAVSVRGEVWFSKNFGIDLDYTTTLSVDLKAQPDSNRSVLIDHRYQSGGFLYRKYFGKSRRAPSLLFGIGYSEYQMIVPRQETLRIRLKTAGPSISIGTRWPTSNYIAWLWGVSLLPKLSVSEQSTAVTVKSGTDETTYAIQVHLGREYVLDRQQSLFWKISHRFEKSVYEGQSDTNDPIGGAAPQGVSVTTGTTMLGIGYTWGD